MPAGQDIGFREQYLRSLKTRSVGRWEWIALRLTGVFLVVFVLAHLWILHYAKANHLSFQDISARLQGRRFQMLDLGLLVLAFAHGLAGVHRVILDLGVLSLGAEKALRWVLFVIGGVGVFLGYRIFEAFLGAWGRAG